MYSCMDSWFWCFFSHDPLISPIFLLCVLPLVLLLFIKLMDTLSPSLCTVLVCPTLFMFWCFLCSKPKYAAYVHWLAYWSCYSWSWFFLLYSGSLHGSHDWYKPLSCFSTSLGDWLASPSFCCACQSYRFCFCCLVHHIICSVAIIDYVIFVVPVCPLWFVVVF